MRSEMKLAVLIMVFIAAASAAYMSSEQKFADDVFVKRQMIIFEIFKNVWQPEIYNEYFEESKSFDYKAIKDQITNLHAYECFEECFQNGFLGRDAIYNPFIPMHNFQMLSVFKMLYYAKDWDAFYKVMVWARFNVNPGMFIQSLSMAVLHRKDFEGFLLPPIFETSPFYFFNNFVITKARLVEMQGLSAMTKDGDTYTYTIPMNYTNFYVNTNHEAKLAYFMEGTLCKSCEQ
jgi:Hemocyanin, all-alpha domain/Hemocyanin, copper containing domain